jgi:hypothetical protein
MKRIAIGVIVVVVIAAITGLSVRRDYLWAPANIEYQTSQGWTLAATTDNFIEPTHPWTIFRTPVTGLWFVKPKAARKIADGVVVVPQMSLHFNYEDTDPIEGRTVFDLRNHRSAFIADEDNVAPIHIEALEWRVFEKHTPGAEVQDFVERTLLVANES